MVMFIISSYCIEKFCELIVVRDYHPFKDSESPLLIEIFDFWFDLDDTIDL